MDKPTKDAIRELVLDLRKKLEGEIERELGRYGIYAERDWIDPSTLPRLSQKERDRDRPRIEAAIRREQDAGLNQAEAVQALIRETAYTHMNRLLGLKCLEVRGLITETVTTRPIYSDRSHRHRDYLDEHPQAHRQPDRGLVAMLQDAYAEVSKQIGVVFDPDGDYSVVWPRHTVLKECIARINDLDEEVARKRGEDPATMTSVYADDTFLGWVYQYFQEEEKARVFREVRTKKKKIGGHDIIPATTAYTERYMVQFLVENSLGALWMEMYPNSDLCERWAYFVEDPNLWNEDGARRQDRELRPVAELTLLDPACGSGHFLLYAFDLFVQMYEAEAQMQGRLVDRAEIARGILCGNLYGIDIDLRSVQLSALNLYMKACTYAGVRLDELENNGSVRMNLVCADIVLRKGPELKELLDRFKGDPLTQDLIKTIWRGLQNAHELGSLLKVEEQVDAAIARKRKAEKDSFWEHPKEAWDLWKRDFLNTLKAYVDRAAESFDVNRRMFGQEAIKGVQLLDLLTRRYAVVASNPPYMGTGNMAEDLREFLASQYPQTKSDLYAVFIERCGGLAKQNGLVGMITQSSFMFLKAYSEFRQALLDVLSVRSLAHLGPGAFGDISGEVVNTVMFSMRKACPTKAHETVFLRLTDARDKHDQLVRLIKAGIDESRAAFSVQQRTFDGIDGKPLVYWAPLSIRHSFVALSQLRTEADIVLGMKTSDNQRFLRYHWEIPHPVGIHDTGRWALYDKGTTGNPFYRATDYVVDWSKDAQRHYSTYYSAQLPNPKYWFVKGLVFSRAARSGFSVKHLAPGHMTDITSSCLIVPHNQKLNLYLLGFLNTLFVRFCMSLLNSSMSFQVIDVQRIPYAMPNPNTRSIVERATTRCVESAKWLLAVELTSREFKRGPLARLVGHESSDSVRMLFTQWLLQHENQILNLQIHWSVIDTQISALYGLSSDDINTMTFELGVPSGFHPILHGYEVIPDDLLPEACEYLDSLPHIELTPEELATVKHNLQQLYIEEGKSIEEISVELEINPVSIVSLRRELGLINPADLKHEVENLLTHRIWELCKQDEDGVIPYDDGLRNPSLLQQVRSEIEALFGANQVVAIEAEMDEILRPGGLARWLGDPFFRKHKSQFKSRPFLWQIISPQKKFRVLVYYHKLDHDTLPKVRGQYLWPLLERARTQLRAAKENGQDPPDMKAIGDLEAYIADLEECDRRLDSVIQGTVEVNLPEWANGPYRNGQAPYHPDLDDGVKVNILPLQAAGLLPMKKVV